MILKATIGAIDAIDAPWSVRNRSYPRRTPAAISSRSARSETITESV